MKVYSAFMSVDRYEAAYLLGVFSDRESATSFIKTQEGYLEDWYEYGVVESELGQTIDFKEMIEWLAV